MNALRRLLAFMADWFDYLVPADEKLEADTPELRAFHNRVEQTRGARSQGSIQKINRRTS